MPSETFWYSLGLSDLLSLSRLMHFPLLTVDLAVTEGHGFKSDSLRTELVILLWLLIKKKSSAVTGVQWVMIRASVADQVNLIATS